MRIPLTGLILIVAAASAGGQATQAAFAPASKLWIEGTSNVHDWKCQATTIDAKIDVDAAGLSAAPASLVKYVSVRVPVASLKCGNGKMDDNLRKALKADQNGEISYTLTTVDAVPGESKDDFKLRTTGTLSIAGTANNVTMDVLATRLPDGTIKASGTVPVRMTAYGVKPPSAMLGAIRTGDEVRVKFELIVGPMTVAASDK